MCVVWKFSPERQEVCTVAVDGFWVIKRQVSSCQEVVEDDVGGVGQGTEKQAPSCLENYGSCDANATGGLICLQVKIWEKQAVDFSGRSTCWRPLEVGILEERRPKV